MTRNTHGSDAQSAIQQWSQGDCVLGPMPMMWGFHPDCPITGISRSIAADSEPILGVSLAAEKVRGFIVVSQTCDIIRAVEDRPFVQVAPIIEVSGETLGNARLRMRPRLAYLPSLAERSLVADLDRIFTVEKALLSSWDRKACLETEEQRRSFSETIRRYYSRAAFPNEFVEGVRELEKWFQKKHDRKPSPPRKGDPPFHPHDCLQALYAVLVRARPSWEALAHVDFYLVTKPEAESISASTWETFKEECGSRVSLPAGIGSGWHEMPFAHLPAKLYLECDILDLEYLSDGTRR